MNAQNSLILLRGLPGAGKSSLATILSEDNRYPMFSVDDYFTSEHGVYDFRFDKNHLAYKTCENNTALAMQAGAAKIFVHNTFTLDWEMEPYFRLAAQHKYRVYVITVENRHGHKNTHQISEEQVKKMAQKYKVRLC